MKKKLFVFPIFIILLAQLGARDDEVWNQSVEKIASMVELIGQNYYKAVEPETLAQASVRGLLETLDPHSYFLDIENFSRMSEEQKGKYYGLGIQIQKQEDRLVVISPMEGTPAWRLGIQAGDLITHINGESTKPISDRDAVSKLRGPKGTKVNITLAREGVGKPIELTIIREEIPLYSVPYAFMLQDGIGYINVRYFAESTTDEFETKMEQLVEKGLKSLILDLRWNPGGPLFQSIDLSDEFLPKDDLVVSIKGRNRRYDQEFVAVRNNQYEKIPLIVLINQGTASASEIVAGAVMDHDRGLIIGEDSWGKGLVQQIFPLAPNMAVALTIAKYYTPSGRSIQRDYSRLEDYLMDKAVPEKEREIKYTDKGRKVLGQGGITPDYEVKFLLLPYTAELRMKGVFFAFVRKFVSHQTPLSKKFIFPQDAQAAATAGPGKILVGRDFSADAAFIEDFRDYLVSNKIAVDAKKFKEAEIEIKRELEREVASALWGNEEGWKAFEKGDPVILKALQAMPEAAKFVDR